MRNGADEGARLAAQIARRASPKEKLSPETRRAAIAYAQKRAAEGVTRTALAEELGVAAMTIGRWLSTGPSTATKLRAVRVVDAPASRGAIVVTTAGGHRVEGLAFDEIVTLLRALG